MRGSKVVAVCIFNELQTVSQFLAFDGASTRTDPFTSGKKYCKSVNNAVFIHSESLFFVSAAATSAFQLEHTSRLLRSVCPGGYRIRTIEYGKILVMLVYGEYYGRVYEVYNKSQYSTLEHDFYKQYSTVEHDFYKLTTSFYKLTTTIKLLRSNHYLP